jgi:hypothetical protein
MSGLRRVPYVLQGRPANDFASCIGVNARYLVGDHRGRWLSHDERQDRIILPVASNAIPTSPLRTATLISRSGGIAKLVQGRRPSSCSTPAQFLPTGRAAFSGTASWCLGLLITGRVSRGSPCQSQHRGVITQAQFLRGLCGCIKSLCLRP